MNFYKYKEKYKQFFLLFIAFFLILMGYLNYNINTQKTIEVSSRDNELNLGDVELVNGEPIESENIFNTGAIVSNDNLDGNMNTNTNENLLSNVIEDTNNTVINDTKNYFEETKIERDRMYSEMLETYQKIVDSTQTPSDQRSIAVQQISNITNIKNSIMIAENLIKNKGFENVVILENNGTVSVVVKSSNLNKEQISQIQNIVQRELKIEVENINISNK